MPLPAPNTPWPPKQWADIYQAYGQWSAWYSGDPDELAAFYGGGAPGTKLDHHFSWEPAPRPSQFRGGLVGTVARWFWGTPTRPNQRRTKLHVPAAEDLAATSADLLFAEPPAFRVDDTAQDSVTQDRLDELFGPSTIGELIEGAEVAAAMSGVFLRAVWDRDITQQPLPSIVHPDSALPVFRWGRMTEVTFHRVLERQDRTVLRHLEHHEPGRVLHGLYEGESDNLGRLVPLDQHPETEVLVDGLGEDGQTITTGIDELDTVYVPNATPNRMWRNHPIGAHLGRSDYTPGVLSLMDALDEAYSSWMRDVRLAKARLIVPQSYLESGGRGQGAGMDLDREVFTELNMLGKGDQTAITQSQFAIRHQEHSATCTELWERIVTGAGYSAQTFGVTGDVAMTATESHARERRSMLTRGKKARHWRLALSQFAQVMLAIDRQQFNSGVTPQPVDVEFAPAVQAQPRERAETARLLSDASAASTETLVRMVHPEWDDDAVNAEVERIDASQPEPPPMVT